MKLESWGWTVSLAMVAACSASPVASVAQDSRAGTGPTQSIAVGSSSACALANNGTVYCWGYGAYGQLGNGSTADQHVPVQATGLTLQNTVAVGGSFACSTGPDGIRCWGDNTYGQLGDGTSVTQRSSAAGRVLSGGGTLYATTKVSAGLYHACSLASDGEIFCWGNSSYDQVGTTAAVNNQASRVNGMGWAVDVAAGGLHTCAIVQDRTVHCWGWNANGQLGNGTTSASTLPVAVSGLGQVIAIAASSSTTCAVTADHHVLCWGDDSQGQVGNGTSGSAPVFMPTAVHGFGNVGTLDRVVGIAASYTSFFAVRDDGSMATWGGGSPGGSPLAASTVPVSIGTGVHGSFRSSPAVELAAGGYSACSLAADGNLWCMGTNGKGQLGDGTTVDRGTPTWNLIPQYVSSGPRVAGGGYHACGLRSGGGTVSCWGSNGYGQVGDHTTTDRPFPVAVTGLTSPTDIVTGMFHSCARQADATVKCWGRDFEGQLDGAAGSISSSPVTVPEVTDVVSLSAGHYHTCALRTDGTVRCWGWNGYGQLGDGSTTSFRGVVTPVGLTGVVSVSAGYNHTCAVLGSGGVACWGSNLNGQFGDGTTTSRLTPWTITGLTQVVEIGAGNGFSCIRGGTTNTVSCFGLNSSNQLGDQTMTSRSTPAPVHDVVGDSLTFVDGLIVGDGTACAIRLPQYVLCWGQNANGEVGDGNRPTNRSSAVSILNWVLGDSPEKAPVSVSGKSTFCSEMADGTVYCWGIGYPGNGGGMGSAIVPTLANISL